MRQPFKMAIEIYGLFSYDLIVVRSHRSSSALQIDELNLSLEKNMQLLHDTQIHVADVEDKLKKSRSVEFYLSIMLQNRLIMKEN